MTIWLDAPPYVTRSTCPDCYPGCPDCTLCECCCTCIDCWEYAQDDGLADVITVAVQPRFL